MHRDTPARAMSDAEVIALTERIRDRVAHPAFDPDDRASIRNAMQAVRAAIEAELWPSREYRPAVAACRALWNELANALLAYRHRARMPDEECHQIMSWVPAPWIGEVRARRKINYLCKSILSRT